MNVIAHLEQSNLGLRQDAHTEPMNTWVNALRFLAEALPQVVSSTPEANKELYIPQGDKEQATHYPLGILGREKSYDWEEIVHALNFVADMCEI